MATDKDYDVVVIGSGPGGYVAAIRASQLGQRAAVIEMDKVGGRCLNYACIPAKAVLRSAELYDEVTNAQRFGIEVKNTKIGWNGIGKYRDRVVRTLTSGVGGLLIKNGVEVIEGAGSLLNSGNVQITSRPGDVDTVSARKIILATGSVARSIPGVEFGGRILSTAEMWGIDELPGSLAVVGAGPSGMEIASAFGRFGTDVTLLEMLDRILPGEDREVSDIAAGEIAKQNVTVHTETAVEKVERTDDGVKLKFSDEEKEIDFLCIAAGRAADTESLGLKAVGIELGETGLVKIDEHMLTSADGVYAIGDLVGGIALAHKASEEGVIAAEHAAGLDTEPLNYAKVPRATFCKPQVASFGLTESEAIDRHGEIAVGRMPFGSIGAATVYGERCGLVKIVGDPSGKKILGAHIVGPRATDLIAELVAAESLGAGYEEIARIVHAHPTFSEGVIEAARDIDNWAIHL